MDTKSRRSHTNRKKGKPAWGRNPERENLVLVRFAPDRVSWSGGGPIHFNRRLAHGGKYETT